MDSHSKTLSGREILEAVKRADPKEIRQHYYAIIHAMQARMSENQEAFK